MDNTPTPPKLSSTLFDTHFPVTSKAMSQYQDIIGISKFDTSVTPKHFYESCHKNLMPFVNQELEKNLPFNSWRTLCGFENGNVAVHTLNVVYRHITNSIYVEQCDDEDQNILKWAALLHDICKRGPPLFYGKDHVHPFTSAALTLKIFHHLNFFHLKDQSVLNSILDLIDKSVNTDRVQKVWPFIKEDCKSEC